MVDYDGEEVTIEEMPFGCVITTKLGLSKRPDTVVIRTVNDAQALIISLGKMIMTLENERPNESN